ncbi:Tether containing UBX domain for GLUT4 [Eufriesea mexicana]|uniref:tether containing UBX domain for GLUT4 n=1 Tax=Eufriesea mexicana TaxID=516756 RepID=UPI00083C8925|nr:PREDICTED: tether containing UBX domain for GLUT4 [Eufriesea mexicana]OAD55874.1 Tether containing UBX domain for GLUT4 [Eufriesea mexicana]
MATNKNVIVRTPNGRRQNIAVSPNTTILQILEDVCRKYEYNIDDYDLKHFNRVLDTNAILRFTGLANNAQLEMVPCTKIRSISTVVIGIQLENGQRLMAEFTPNVTLAEILQKVNVNEDFETITLIYMHRQISGAEALRTITLKSLGLNSGKAVLRLIHKSAQNIDTIALTTSETVKVNNISDTNKRSVENRYPLAISSDETSDSIISTKEEVPRPEELDACSGNIEQKTTELTKLEKEREIIPSISTDDCNKHQILVPSCNKHEIDNLKNIQFLGERNALVFNQGAIQGSFRDDLPDDFFDLTVNDAKILLRDVKRYRKELEEAPLLTNTQRQLNQEKRILNQLNRYHYTIIRIQFPDQFVLQGLFQPMETVQAIKDFIKCYLIDTNSDFIIFTTPPKHILNPNAHLINENLVPCAIVHYSGPSTLKLDVKQKFTDPREVELQVAEVRKAIIKQETEITNNEDQEINPATTSKAVSNTCNSNESLNEKKNKIPKWFNSSYK